CERLAVRALARSDSIIGPHRALLASNRARIRRWVAATRGVQWVEPVGGATALIDLGIGDVWSYVERLGRERETWVVPWLFFGEPRAIRLGFAVDPGVLEE